MIKLSMDSFKQMRPDVTATFDKCVTRRMTRFLVRMNLVTCLRKIHNRDFITVKEVHSKEDWSINQLGLNTIYGNMTT